MNKHNKADNFNKALLVARDIQKYFTHNGQKTDILASFSISLQAGQSVAIVGPSGCGKTTALQILGLLDTFSSGELYINNINCKNITEPERTKIRKKLFGFIYQSYQLLPEFSVAENIIIAQLIFGQPKLNAKKKADEIIKRFNMEDKATLKPSQLSGGQQQRVGIMRALVNNPPIIFADEPTGNLDPKNAKDVFSLLLSQAKNNNSAVLTVTHNLELAKSCDKVYELKNGVLEPRKMLN